MTVVGSDRRSTGEVVVHEAGVQLVMLVDDDMPLRRAVARGLMAAGYKVLEADDLRQARQTVEVQMADLFLVDLHLPDGNGTDLVRHVKACDPSLPVLVLSGTPEQDERIQAFEAGADDVVGKPVCMTELVKRIEVHSRILRSAAALQTALLEADHMRTYAAEAAALMAHDLNNGLCVASGNLAFLAEAESVTGDAESKDAVAATQRALRRMATLVKNFVDIARSEDGALKAALVSTDIREILRTAASVHHLRGAAAERGIEIDCAAGLVASVDPILVERILHNLLINATRYVDPSGRVMLSAARSPDGRTFTIRVMNTGPSIPPALRERLFEKYRKGDDRKAQSGMGLYFCRLACEAHGGAIRLGEHPDFGTCFEVTLPAQAPR
ncbi:MAG TPA: hybrid sensor histidine kinase/response regulator [Kofleriaceae bacterium]|nr:hybrid sensor histidine kinase/response regulator [Kofleriaceae bacterium]